MLARRMTESGRALPVGFFGIECKNHVGRDIRLTDGKHAHSGAILIDDHDRTAAKLGIELLYCCSYRRDKPIRQNVLGSYLNDTRSIGVSDREHRAEVEIVSYHDLVMLAGIAHDDFIASVVCTDR